MSRKFQTTLALTLLATQIAGVLLADEGEDIEEVPEGFDGCWILSQTQEENEEEDNETGETGDEEGEGDEADNEEEADSDP